MLSVEGEIICASARECSFFCVATDVSRRIVLGLLSPKEHGLLKKAAPCKICGFSSPNFVPTRREDSSLVINTSRSGKTRSTQQNAGKAPTRRPQSSNVSQSSLRTTPNTQHIQFIELSSETLLSRAVE